MTPTGRWIHEVERMRRERGEEWYQNWRREVLLGDLKVICAIQTLIILGMLVGMHFV